MNSMRSFLRLLPITGALVMLSLPATLLAQAVPSILRVTEVDANGHRQDHGPEEAIGNVDIDCKIWVTPLRDSIMQLLGSPAISKPPEQTDKFARSRGLLLMMLAQDDTLARLSEEVARLAIDSSKRAGDKDSATAKALSNKLLNLSLEFGRAEDSRNSALYDYLSAKGYTDIQIEDTAEAIYPENGDYSRLSAFLNRELAGIDAEIAARTNRIYSGAAKATVILTARLIQGSQTITIHLPNYDTAPNIFHQPQPKVSLQLTQQQVSDLNQEVKFYQTLAAIVRHSDTTGGSLQKFLNQQRRKVGLALDSLRRALGQAMKSIPDSAFAHLRSLGGAVFKDNSKLSKSFTAFLSTADSLYNAARGLKDSVGVIVRVWYPPSSEAQPGIYLDSLLVKFHTLKWVAMVGLPRILRLSSRATSSFRTFNNLYKGSGVNNTDPDFVAVLNAFTGSQGLHVESELIGIAQSDTSIIMPVVSAWSSFSSAVAKSKDMAAVGQLPVSDDSYIKKPLSQLVPTYINVATLGAEEGSMILLTAQVYDSRDSGKLAYEQDQYLKVVKMGLTSDVAAGLVFVNAISKPYVGQVKNLPTVATAYLLRIRFGRETYPYLSIGIHAALMNFDTSVPYQVGIGPSLHLFRDILQGGFGWNLHAPGTPEYWYVGVGILDIVNSLSKLTK